MRMLALTVAFQGFKPVSRWRAKKVECFGDIQHSELASGHVLEGPERLRMAAVEQRFRELAGERLNSHGEMILRRA